VGNNRGGEVELDYVLHGEENDDHLDRGHDQSQSAKRQREEYEPTRRVLAWITFSREIKIYLDLQQIISPETLIMHLMVGIICVTSTLIFHKGKPTYRVNGRCIVVTSRMPRNGILTVD